MEQEYKVNGRYEDVSRNFFRIRDRGWRAQKEAKKKKGTKKHEREMSRKESHRCSRSFKKRPQKTARKRKL